MGTVLVCRITSVCYVCLIAAYAFNAYHTTLVSEIDLNLTLEELKPTSLNSAGKGLCSCLYDML